MCQNWRDAGRAGDASHPAKIDKLKYQRIMRQITREDESRRACQLHDELMEVHFKDISRVSQKLKKIRGDKAKSSEIPLIDTLCGRFIGDNVLEGFRRNTEVLCNENPDIIQSDHSFLKMCQEDNMIIFQLATDENIQIPLMSIETLKDILFRKLKIGKACDVY